MKTRHRYMSLAERLEAGTIREPSGCWVWMGGRVSSGYGAIKDRGKQLPVHRAAYELYVGPIPEGLVLDHLCRNRPCWRPAHLEVVTQQVNTLRGVGLTASQALQTHCKHGHEFTPENTYTGGSPPGRRCRTCRREQERIRRERRLAEQQTLTGVTP